MEEEVQNQDICRVCRCEGTSDRPLFHPCVCTGSIKFIHQDCLVQWLRYSHKEYCELCKHNFSFTPIYSPDMPKRLPIKDIVLGIARSAGRAIWFWFHYTAVIMAWLGVVPLSACRIYRCLFTGSVSSLFKLPHDLFSMDNLRSDIFQGSFVVAFTLAAFIGLVWLREQILHGGGPDWLDPDVPNEAEEVVNPGEIDFAANENAENNAEADEELIHEAPGAALAVANNNNGEPAGMADELNWNPIEWDRAAEELTWERLLGLDGSSVFIEHVFWVVSLNTLFILVFAFCPYHIGHVFIVALNMEAAVEASHFEGFLTALVGYCCIGVCFVMLHALACVVDLQRPKRIFGLCYVVVKVALLFVVELVVIPLVGGWWLDICSLSVFEATLKDRENDFRTAPGTSMFVHWFVGLMYVFYFASSVLLLREVLRPGVLWFLRNLNDPDFNPIQEMIHLPLIRHTRRFLASIIIFGSTVLLMLWLPSRIIHFLWPSFLPYQTAIPSDSPAGELSLELILLQVVLPALLDQGNTRLWFKYLIRKWCIVVSYVLGIRSYLLGDVPLTPEGDEVLIGEDGRAQKHEEIPVSPENDNVDDPPVNADAPPPVNAEAPPPVNVEAAPPLANVEPPPLVNEVPLIDENLAGGLGAAHQALLQRDGPTGFQSYVRPSYFGLRVAALVVLMCVTLTLSFVVFLTLPVWVGRKFITYIFHKMKVHEVYTWGCGLYMCLLAIRCAILVVSWCRLGWSLVMQRIKQWVWTVVKFALTLVVVAGVIPLMIGILFEVVIMVPFKVPVYQTPIFFYWQCWVLGVLYTKIACAICMMGPNWWLKFKLQQIYLDGVRNLNIHLVIVQTGLPVIFALATCLAVPYVIAMSIAPLLFSKHYMLAIERSIYPGVFCVTILCSLAGMQLMQFARLYEHIKNDKYLVGKRLVNYNHNLDSTIDTSVVNQEGGAAQDAL